MTERVEDSSQQVIYYSVLLTDLEILGLVDIQISYSLTDNHIEYDLSKYTIPIYINDCESLKKCIGVFFGSPFSMIIEKIPGINFARYSIEINKCVCDNPSDFFVSMGLLKDILINIDKHTIYD
ncbi:hypothetical protein [uncultured Vagococcus sp.]|uniref:hypothetical protein n=1 Tax=uncultured Vagococcus sp. TaxID=189676 RepID=UPI0025880AE4|nr:hypothetical protein [uncultured Vagococcus sp.]